MLKDPREEVRRMAVLWILRARKEFNIDEHPRQFKPATIQFQVEKLDTKDVHLVELKYYLITR